MTTIDRGHPGLWNTCSPDSRKRGRDGHDQLLRDAHIHPYSLCNKYGRGGLIERRAIHIDGRAKGQDKLGGLFRYTGLFYSAFHRHRKRGRGACRRERCQQSLGHLKHKPKWIPFRKGP